MKRFTRLALACAMVLLMVSMATAQAPTPVVRMGDWVEVGNDVWMNIIATNDIRYRAVHNYDFEDDIQDRTLTQGARGPDITDTAVQDQEGDHMRTETRFGVDFRYKKSTRLRVLFEHQSLMDGNIIDDRTTREGEPTNLERFWIEHRFAGTPIRIRVGADLWFSDPAGLLGDDDPRFAIYADLQDLELGAWAVIQTESTRTRGLQNDNDDTYYVFHARYKGMKPHEIGLDIAYFRWRNRGASGIASGLAAPAGAATAGQKHDVVLIMPSYTGKFGPISALFQFNFLAGTAEGNDATGGADYDVFAWAIVAYAEADLGMIRPFVGLFYGSGDDNPNDRDLGGFHTLPQNEISLINATRWFGFLTTTLALGNRDVGIPGRANTAGLAPAYTGGVSPFLGNEFTHTTGGPWNDRLGNRRHFIGGASAINSAYSNPGTIAIPVGVKIYPTKGHNVNLFYIFRGMVNSDLLDAAFGTEISNSLYHEIAAIWTWTLSRHFDIRVAGHIAIAADGGKDIAEQVLACGDTNTEPCDGDEPALQGEVRFRGRF